MSYHSLSLEVLGRSREKLWLSLGITWESWWCPGHISYQFNQSSRARHRQQDFVLKVSQVGISGWLSGLVPAFGSGHNMESQDRVPRWAPGMEPASPSVCVSASLYVYHEWIKRILKKKSFPGDSHMKSSLRTHHCFKMVCVEGVLWKPNTTSK